jgi:hypothetical protein
MPNVEHSKPLKMATAALSKIIGARAAAKVAGVDWRTVERWVKGSQDGDEAEWTAARELAQARHLEALIRGDTRGATQWATSAGISARNQRYARLIAARDQRKAEQAQPEQPEQTETPWVTALHALDEVRGRSARRPAPARAEGPRRRSDSRSNRDTRRIVRRARHLKG